MTATFKKTFSNPLIGGSLLFIIAAATTGLLTAGRQWTDVTVPLAVAYAIATFVSRAMPTWSRPTGWLLLAAGILMTAGIGMNIHVWTADSATLSRPNLMFDYSRDFYAAVQYAEYGIEPTGIKKGYQIIIGSIMKVCGVNVAYPTALSMMFTLLSISLSGVLAAKLLNTEENRKRVALKASLLTALIAIVILHGTVVLKDAGVMLAFTCLAYTLAENYKGRLSTFGIIISAIGAIMLIIFKPQLGFMYLAGILVSLFFNFRSHRVRISDYILLALLTYAIIAGGEYFQHETLDESFHPNTAGFLAVDGPDLYGRMMGEYYGSSWWFRFLLAPFTSAVQTLLPLPWHWFRDMRLGGFFWYGHLTYFWYAISACIFAYFIFLWGRKHSGGLSGWALWWLMCYAGTAVYSTGTSARYFMPFIPMGIPIAMQFIHSFRVNKTERKKYMIFLCSYGLIIIIGLVVARIWFSN